MRQKSSAANPTHVYMPCRLRERLYERVAAACLRTGVAFGHALATVVDEGAELDRDVDGDAEHVGLDGRAEADGGLQVGEAVEEAAARLSGHLAGLALDEAEHVDAHAEFERVHRALAAG